MDILIIGSGGREHALAWRLAQSPECGSLYCSPGNPGTARLGTNVSLNLSAPETVVGFCRRENIGLVVVGPEEPLVHGLADELRTYGITVLGPGADGARLEGSKEWSKAFMQRHNIPTARFGAFGKRQLAAAFSQIDTMQSPYVIKADGLAAGKGVVIAQTIQEAKAATQAMLEGQFGMASERVVIEEFLEGIEVSVFALTDGKSFVLLPEAKDYKRIGEGDTGPNTGGMGSVSPVPFVTDELRQRIVDRVVVPTLQGLREEGVDYRGFLFFGLMIVSGRPYLLEYNVRMGDPETQSVMARIDEDLLPWLVGAAQGQLPPGEIRVSGNSAATVVCASQGYPGAYDKGYVIDGLDRLEGAIAFHAGTALNPEGRVVTSGGRVLGITATGDTLRAALDSALANARKVGYTGRIYRRDIGHDLT